MGSIAERTLQVRTEKRGRNAIGISVQDSGPGIEAAQMDRIFSPFTTTKKNGMGLGLTICRMIVERHGGKLSASSDAGTGARFDITLPVEPAADPDQQSAEKAIAVIYPRLIQPHLGRTEDAPPVNAPNRRSPDPRLQGGCTDRAWPENVRIPPLRPTIQFETSRYLSSIGKTSAATAAMPAPARIASPILTTSCTGNPAAPLLCPKCGSGMYVIHRTPDRKSGGFKYEHQTLECLNCSHPRIQTAEFKRKSHKWSR
jgi:hypothetical protein